MEIKTQSSAGPAAIVLLIQVLSPQPVCAQVYVEADRLLQVIEAQQRQLEKQEAQLRRQKNDLDVLRQQVEAMGKAIPSRSPIAEFSPPHRARDDPAILDQTDIEELISTTPTDWPGSIPVLGSAMRVKISGFAELDANYDTDAIVSPAQFVPSQIISFDKTAAEGADGQTDFTVQTSRLAFETKTPWNGRDFTTYISMDFLQDSKVTTPNPRMRKAYGEISNLFWGGGLLVGQDWTTFANLVAIPYTLDFQGPNAVVGLRHSMLRWSKKYADQFTLKAAIEAPGERIFEDALTVSRWPDAVFVFISQANRMNLQAGLVLRDLRASGEPESTLSTTGWGLNLSGTFNMPGALSQDSVSYSLSFGEGFGGLLNDGPPDAAYDIYNNSLEAVPTSAWYLGYQHWWTPSLYTVATYGRVRQDNLDFQPGESYRQTQYGSTNLTWVPFPQWLLGIEALYGSREDKDGASGSLWRTQFTTRVTF